MSDCPLGRGKARGPGRAVGSELIGQPFQAPKYFWGRPSATTPMPYNAGSSGGSNREPTFWNSIWPWMGGRGNIT